MVVTLHQHDVGAVSPGGERRGGTGRAAAHHQHVGLGENRDLACRLLVGERGTPAPGPPLALVEDLDALLAADGAGQVFAGHLFFPSNALP